MTGYSLVLVVLLLGALLPALLLSARGEAMCRLVGVQVAGSAAVVVFLVLSEILPSYVLIIPLVLVPLVVAGTLVYTRLLRP